MIRRSIAWLGLGLVSASLFGCMHAMHNRCGAAMSKAAPAIDTIGDIEVARTATYSTIGNLEGMHRMMPHNEDVLLLLTQTWFKVGYNFAVDDWEAATDNGDEDLAEEHRTRARAAYTRAMFYGVERLEHRAQDFSYARRDPRALAQWLSAFGPDDAPALLWTGAAWLARGEVSADVPSVQSELSVGVALVERSIALDEKLHWGWGHTVLGMHFGNAADHDLERSNRHFRRALQLSDGKLPMTKFEQARSYFCPSADRDAYQALLQQVAADQDPIPEQRLWTAVAQRRARRYLSDVRNSDCGF